MRPEAAPAVRTLLRELGPELPAAISTLPEPFLTPLLTVLSVADTALVSPLPTSIEVVRRDLITLATAPRVATYLAQSRTPGGAEVLRRRLLIALALSEAARPVVQHRVETLERIVVSLASLSPFGSAPGRSFRQLLLECAKRLAQEVTGRLIGGKNSEDIGIESEFEALLEAMSSSGRPSAPADVDGSGDRNSIAQVADRAEEKTERRQSEPPHLPVSWEGFEPTGCAGIVYLIRLMQSVYGWLDRPEHLTRATGQRLLFRIIERLHLHPEDPVMCFLRSLGAMPDPQEIPLGFHLVPDMLPRRRARACVSSITSYPGWRMATLGRLTLAVWHGRAPPPLQKLLRSAGGIERCASRSFCDDMMISSCELGLRRLLRQGPRLSRLQLLRREGVLAATSTHLDVVFDAALIDLTIRRWALDVSPGWCLWLWRVVTIHYDFGEADAGR